MLEGAAVAIHCADGDTVLYPVASLHITVGGKTMEMKAAVSGTLPLVMLLGPDAPELHELPQRQWLS